MATQVLPTTEMKYFLSYAREDKAFATRLAQDLRGVVDVWFDERINAGQLWDIEVQKALKDCAGMLVVLSRRAVASQNVMDEVSYGLDEGKRVVPLVYRRCTIPFRLRRLQRVDFTKNYSTAFEQLKAYLKGGVSSSLERQGLPWRARTIYGVSVAAMVAAALIVWLVPIVKVDASVAPTNAAISINGDPKVGIAFWERFRPWDVRVTDVVENSSRAFKVYPMDLIRAGFHPRPTWRLVYQYTFQCLPGQCPRPSKLTAQFHDGPFDSLFEDELRQKGVDVINHSAIAVPFEQQTVQYVPLLAGKYSLHFDGSSCKAVLPEVSVAKPAKYGIQVDCT